MKEQGKLEIDSWTIAAALVGFLSGAGLMSHSDVLHMFSEDLYQFINITDGAVTVYARQMVEILVAMVSYLLVLFLVAAGSVVAMVRTRDVRVMWACLGILLLMISFFGTALSAADRGYQPITTGMNKAREVATNRGESLRVHWVWR